MKIAIIGAGVAGLCTAKILRAAGHEVVVHDRTPDVGGVWSATRRYPGLTTQSPKAQYAFSDHPMPHDYPEWPSGAQVQAWLDDYAQTAGLGPHLRLSTEVTAARPEDAGWVLDTRDGTGTTTSTRYDALVVANGVFCEPAVPNLPGLDECGAAGGRLGAGSDFHEAAEGAGRDVVVVGYGKTACDIAVAVAGTAASTNVVARQLHWKVPRRIAGAVNFKMLLLTRLGEALFRYIRLRGVERFLHGPGNGLRRRLLNSLGTVSVRQYGLRRTGLVPRGQMEDIVRGAIGLTSDGFFESVQAGAVTVRRDRTVARLAARAGAPVVELSDGAVLGADVVVCATGYRQGVPFLDEDVTARILDERGNFALYRQILPVDVPGLYFNGYNSSFFSPLNAEMAALWIAADLGGGLDRPALADMRAAVAAQLAFMDDATDGHHCRGTKIIPFSLHNVDEVLDDLGANIPARVRALHWLNPVDPAAYRDVAPRVLARLAPHLVEPAVALAGPTPPHRSEAVARRTG